MLSAKLAEIGPVILEIKLILKFVNAFSIFYCYLPLEKDVAFYLMCAKFG